MNLAIPAPHRRGRGDRAKGNALVLTLNNRRNLRRFAFLLALTVLL